MQIVLVDDDPDVLGLVMLLLQGHGFGNVASFLDPKEGLAWCEHNDVDLLLVDYMMPELDGLQFIRCFRAIPRQTDVPLLMLTSVQDSQVRYEALQLGANDFLGKPVDLVELAARIKNMLVLRQGQKRLKDRASWLAEEVRKATEQIQQREHETIIKLSRASEYRDPETGSHILRMAQYSRLIAAKLGLSAEQQRDILDAAPMHDIGKVGVPDHILLKRGKLDERELNVMRQHTRIGYSILSDSQSSLMQLAASIALTHHEKFDGSGYPAGLKGEAIPLAGRIVIVADVFDALTSVRPYKQAWPFAEAEAYLQQRAGKYYDPACVEAFLSCRDEVVELHRDINAQTQYVNLAVEGDLAND